VFSQDGALLATVKGGPLCENLEWLRELTHLTLHCAGWCGVMWVLSFLLVPSLSLLFQHEPLFSFSNSTCINQTSYATSVKKLHRDKGKCICLSITCLHHMEHSLNIEFLSQFLTLPILTDTVIGKHNCTGGAMPVVLTSMWKPCFAQGPVTFARPGQAKATRDNMKCYQTLQFEYLSLHLHNFHVKVYPNPT